MHGSDDDIVRQSAAVPFRVDSGVLKILLISSRGGRRWIVPKGIIEDYLTPEDSAAEEAYEEAGAHGEVFPGDIGAYRYNKWGGTCHVTVYLMRVDSLDDDFPEAGFRERKWVEWKQALEMIQPEELRRIVARVPKEVETRGLR